MSRRRYRKNPSKLTTGLMIGGGAIAAFVAYSVFFKKKASAATLPATAPEPAATPMTVTTDVVRSIGTGISSIGSGIASLFGGGDTSREIDLFKAYQMKLNANGAKLVIDGIIGQKTLDANNKLIPKGFMGYTSIKLLKEAILEGKAGLAGLGNYIGVS